MDFRLRRLYFIYCLYIHIINAIDKDLSITTLSLIGRFRSLWLYLTLTLRIICLPICKSKKKKKLKQQFPQYRIHDR